MEVGQEFFPSRHQEPPLVRIARNHARILDICQELERLADHLPALPDESHHLVIAQRLGATLRRVNAVEEREFLPLLVQVLEPCDVDQCVETLMEEHRQDEAFADEVAEVLLEWAVGERRYDAATVGYMLRGLFDNLRRHIAREHDHLLVPLSRAE